MDLIKPLFEQSTTELKLSCYAVLAATNLQLILQIWKLYHTKFGRHLKEEQLSTQII